MAVSPGEGSGTMSAPMSAQALIDALKAEGVKTVEYKSWRTHNRAGHGAWGPLNGVMIHHTVTRETSPSVALVYNGRSGLPGPLAHGMIGKDGKVYLVGWGRANHAGGGDPAVLRAVIAESYGVKPPATHQHEGSAGAVDGNPHFVGFECENLGDGKDPWPAVQYEAMVRAAAAVCRHYRWSAKSVIGHLEWSDWKPDPRGFSMQQFRTDVAACLKAKAGTWHHTAPKAPAPAPKPLTLTQRVARLEHAVFNQS